jgi:hypothetical protein
MKTSLPVYYVNIYLNNGKKVESPIRHKSFHRAFHTGKICRSYLTTRIVFNVACK